MGYLEEFGFKIFRLKDEKVDREFVLYNMKTKDYNFLSEKRLVSILLLEFRDREINLRKFAIEELNYEEERADPKKLIMYWKHYEVILLNSIGYKPTEELIFETNGKKYFNIFILPETLKKSNYKKKISFEQLKLKAPYHYKLLQNLHNFDDKAIEDTLLKIADKIKYPNNKAQDCIIFYPGEGSGKGIFFKYVLNVIFGRYASKILMKRLNNDFNSFLRTPLILVLEEGKRDLELIETLKELTTESKILINEKGKPQEEENIYFLVIVYSNNMNPLDLGKRRGSYHLTHSLGKTVELSQKIGKELCEKLPNETTYLLRYLHGLEFKHQDALMPFNTKAKEQVTNLNKTALELFYDELISYKTLDHALIDLHNKRFSNSSFSNFELNIETIKSKDGQFHKFIAKDIIKNAYNHFCHIEGLRSNIIRHNKDIVQLWALMKVPDTAHQRILVKEGVNRGRKLDHIRFKDLAEHILEVNNDE